MDGTGSILQVKDQENPDCDSLKISQRSVRFLSPREVANLHCFPNEFG